MVVILAFTARRIALASAIACALGFLGTFCALFSRASAQPRVPPATLSGVLSGDLVARARVRWSQIVNGQRVEVIIGVGSAERRNPNWSPAPVHIKYDLDRNRELSRALKRDRLGPSTSGTTDPEARTLELLGQGPMGWEVVGSWSLPRKTWLKRHAALFHLLEPLFQTPADVFAPGPAKPS